MTCLLIAASPGRRARRGRARSSRNSSLRALGTAFGLCSNSPLSRAAGGQRAGRFAGALAAGRRLAPMSAAYLDKLNPQQRAAVEHGGAGQDGAAPLLIIAGAGSGKTNTLAHRVAHLIINGADPRRILLL